ncbi:MAG: aldo/keto reductase [Bacilli bacterium]
MEKRNWYKRDISTSLLGFGCMRFNTIDGVVDANLAEKLIDFAYLNGVNYFDTAKVYLDGQSEPILGKALNKFDRKTFYIATKFSIWNFEDIKDVENMIDEQLKSLQTDYIDFYLLHAMNKDRFKKVKDFKVLELVKKWKNEGKIRNIGFSFHDDSETFKEIINYYDWDFCQIQFNYMDKNIQQGMDGYRMLVDRKIPIIVMEPLKGGKLAGFNESVEQTLKKYNQDSMAKWAFRWVASQEGIMTVLSGMNTMEQLVENIGIYNNFKRLSDEESRLIDIVGNELRDLEVVGCTKCQYCMPCPYGVNIPQNFTLINEYEMYKNKDGFLWGYKVLEKNSSDFSVCVECQECVSKCPQFINIPEELKLVGKLKDNLL